MSHEPTEYPPLRLRDLGGVRAIPEWRELTWDDCYDCGGVLFGPIDHAEAIYDGEPVVCVDCGEVHGSSVDEDGASIHDRETRLRPTALAGLRRLLKITPSWPEVSVFDAEACARCGCTELEACEGGCTWALTDDDDNLVCSACTTSEERGWLAEARVEDVPELEDDDDEPDDELQPACVRCGQTMADQEARERGEWWWAYETDDGPVCSMCADEGDGLDEAR